MKNYNIIERIFTALYLSIFIISSYVLLPTWINSCLIAIVGLYTILIEWPAFNAWLLTPLYPFASFVFLIVLNQMYTSLLIFITLIVVATDTFAYLGGKLYGSHLLAPSISPNKTWEGLITGLLASVGIGLITANYLHYHLSYQLVVWIICISLATIAGDLFESYLKRRANLKDSGSLLPGHGGILDRIDGLLFATPVGYIFFRIFGL